MATDIIVSRELKGLQDELSTSQQERSAAIVPPTITPNPPGLVDEPADERELRDQLAQFVDEATRIFDEAEKTIATHPTQSVVGALVVGVLIGRLLGRG